MLTEQEQVQCTALFQNDVMSVQLTGVGMSIAGYSSRKSVWKNWNVKFDAFNAGQGCAFVACCLFWQLKCPGKDLVQDVYEIDLKSGSEDSSMVRNVLNMVGTVFCLFPCT